MSSLNAFTPKCGSRIFHVLSDFKIVSSDWSKPMFYQRKPMFYRETCGILLKYKTRIFPLDFYTNTTKQHLEMLDSPTDVLFKQLVILKFFDIYFYQIGKFMYLFKGGLLPNYLRNMFTLASQLHSHYTRNCNLYYIPPCRPYIRNFTIRFQGSKFFNSLSPEIIKTLKASVCLAKDSFLVKYTLCWATYFFFLFPFFFYF